MRIRFFGILGEAIGREVELGVPNGCTVGELRSLLAAAYPHAGELLHSRAVRACLGDALVGEDAFIAAEGEVEFFPPLSGG